ncbi:MAG: molecular chaperone HtpG [Flavobacteriales bacterium]|nr:molecular chaperone HtpG [Flavobacteriales bacterium]
MTTQTEGTLKVHTENIFPIIKKFLYSDHEIFLRELVSNAQDACQKVKTLSISGEIKHDGKGLRVEVIADKNANTLTIRDNGIGMTQEEVEKYINQIAFSGAEEFVEKYKDAQIIGHFGLGFYSAFMVSKQVEIQTLSQREGATAVHWTCDGSPNFTMEPGHKTTPGTDIILHLADDSLEFAEESRVQGILDKYCKFMPNEIQFGEKSDWIESDEVDEKGEKKEVEVKVPNIINNTEPLWLKKPADLQDEDYKKFYRELYPMTFDEPLFHIHINVDYPFNLTGILFFPKMKNNFEIQKNKVQLYSNQVFITDEVKNILPDFLTLLHGVVDSPDIPLNVSRSYLQEDANVKKISSHISKKVADKLQSMFNNDRGDFEGKWDDIGTFIQYGMLTDEKFYEKAEKFSLLKTAEDKFLTLSELKEKIQDTQKDKKGEVVVLYANNKEEQHAQIDAAKERGYQVIILDGPLAPHFISQAEQKNSGLRFKRVDADVMDKLIEKSDEMPSTLSDDQKNNLKTALENFVDKKKFQVEFASLSPTEAPFVVTQNEFMRRMKEQSMMGGGGFYGTLPDSYNLVANANHPMFSNSITDAEGKPVLNEEKVKQAIDLALLAKGLLKGEDLTKFVKANLEKLAH